jgi:hypothetical protein
MGLVVSFVGKKIVFFGPTDQKLWVFEVSRRSLGRAGMYWSQSVRVDHLCKKWKAGRKKKFKKNGNSPTSPGVNPRPADDCWSPAAGRHLRLLGCPYFFEIF